VTTDAAGDPYASIFPDYRISASKDDMAFIGELGLVGTYKWRPNLILRASYDFMWVAGLAVAPEQITYATDPPDQIKVKGLGAYQGFSLGFEWLW
jgi:predicted component of type VI protein secretion system